VKYGFGLRLPFLGPLETADLAGLDLAYDVHQYLFPDLENRSTPSPLLKTLVDQKTTGVKAKKGFIAGPTKVSNKSFSNEIRLC
jgi:3-hydroxybutyryl-CoA dehydrogenase